MSNYHVMYTLSISQPDADDYGADIADIARKLLQCVTELFPEIGTRQVVNVSRKVLGGAGVKQDMHRGQWRTEPTVEVVTLPPVEIMGSTKGAR